MKTLKELQKRYSELTKPFGRREFTDRDIKNMQKEAKFIKGCILFLETNPKFEVVKKWHDETLERLDKINDEERLKSWIRNDKDKDPDEISATLYNEFHAEWNKLSEKPKYMNQLKTLKFILS